MKKHIIILTAVLLLAGCQSDNDFLYRSPSNAFSDEQTWSSEVLMFANLTDLYNRYVDYQGVTTWYAFCDFDEGYSSAVVDQSRHKNATYGYGNWSLWDYGYIRHINLFIEKCGAADDGIFADHGKERMVAEARFLRASIYFEMVKRMGGVPLITESLTYDFNGDPTYLQHPRKKEYEIYDFVLQELEDIKDMLPNDRSVQTRASKGAALAMRSRAALYAGAIAKYGAQLTPTVSTPGGEVGIPANMADKYYEIALESAEELIADGKYNLYEKHPSDRSENFAQLFLDKTDNVEAIFVKDFKKPSVRQWWTRYSIPISIGPSTANGSLNGTLNLAQQFELVEGNAIQPFRVLDGAQPVVYDNPQDIFAGRDPRLAATFILPGSSFAEQPVDILTGWVDPAAPASPITGTLGQEMEVAGMGTVRVTGLDGPRESQEWGAHSGMYVRKYTDPTAGSGDANTGSDTWFIRFRYAEVLLNAAEAAFEHSTQQDKNKAMTYINRVRQRAGFTTALTEADITFDRVVHERRVELAYEGHHFWDMKRWRLAHTAWNGATMDNKAADPAEPAAVNTQALGLQPYRLFNAGPLNGKWIYNVVTLKAAQGVSHQFRLGNYYSEIGSTILSNNPQIVKQPNQ